LQSEKVTLLEAKDFDPLPERSSWNGKKMRLEMQN
jgi:hypothetical protein